MRIVTIPPMSFMGISSGLPTRYELHFNKQEQAAITRADDLIDQARELIREHMGTSAFDESPFFTLGLHDCIDFVAGWSEYDRMETHK